ncbi:MAG: DUF1415 domain-containing protein [Proteobacteria bacterium]|nr:DUF1415 domain-containing protein [Pseudomonadota bacterium]
MNNNDIINSVRHWLEQAVIGLNLCPFAKREFDKDRVRFSMSDASSEEQLLSSLITELELLNKDESIETTLLIHPGVLQNFYDYNDFLDVADGLLIELNLEGIYQIASFHPDYQFAETDYDDVENFTNRSPYPLLHIIREQSLELAIAGHPNADGIPERNITLLKEMGKDKMQTLFKSYFNAAK